MNQSCFCQGHYLQWLCKIWLELGAIFCELIAYSSYAWFFVWKVFRDWSNTLPHFPCQPITLQPVLEAPVLRFCASIYCVIWILQIWQEGLGRLSCCCALFVIWHHIDLQWASFNFENFSQTNRNMFPWQWTNHVFAKVIICNGFAKYGLNLEPYFANSLHILAYAWFSVCKESVCC